MLQAPEGIRGTWEEVKGKAVVLEFWATWCGGWVDNIPHLNELAKKFESRPLQFISITDKTDVEFVKRFLMRHPIRGWIALDAAAGTFKRYGITGRPQTLLVDRSGVVQCRPGAYQSLVSNSGSLGGPNCGQDAQFPGSENGAAPGLQPGVPSPLIQVLIRPAAPVQVSGYSPGGIVNKNGRYEVYGNTLRQILSDAYQVPGNRVDAPEWCSNARYDFTIVTPQHEGALRWPLLQQVLAAAFKLKLHMQLKETPVYILRKLDGQQPKLRPATGEGQSDHPDPKGELEAMGRSMAWLTARPGICSE